MRIPGTAEDPVAVPSPHPLHADGTGEEEEAGDRWGGSVGCRGGGACVGETPPQTRKPPTSVPGPGRPVGGGAEARREADAWAGGLASPGVRVVML